MVEELRRCTGDIPGQVTTQLKQVLTGAGWDVKNNSPFVRTRKYRAAELVRLLQQLQAQLPTQSPRPAPTSPKKPAPKREAAPSPAKPEPDSSSNKRPATRQRPSSPWLRQRAADAGSAIQASGGFGGVPVVSHGVTQQEYPALGLPPAGVGSFATGCGCEDPQCSREAAHEQTAAVAEAKARVPKPTSDKGAAAAQGQATGTVEDMGQQSPRQQPSAQQQPPQPQQQEGGDQDMGTGATHSTQSEPPSGTASTGAGGCNRGSASRGGRRGGRPPSGVRGRAAAQMVEGSPQSGEPSVGGGAPGHQQPPATAVHGAAQERHPKGSQGGNLRAL